MSLVSLVQIFHSKPQMSMWLGFKNVRTTFHHIEQLMRYFSLELCHLSLPCHPQSYATSVTHSIHVFLHCFSILANIFTWIRFCCWKLKMGHSLVYEVDVRTPHLVGRNPQNFDVVIFLWVPWQPVVWPCLEGRKEGRRRKEERVRKNKVRNRHRRAEKRLNHYHGALMSLSFT